MSGNYVQYNRYSTYEPNVDYRGGDYSRMLKSTPQSCQEACINDDQCVAWTHNANDQVCYMKNQQNPSTPSNVAISGVIIDNTKPNTIDDQYYVSATPMAGSANTIYDTTSAGDDANRPYSYNDVYDNSSIYGSPNDPNTTGFDRTYGRRPNRTSTYLARTNCPGRYMQVRQVPNAIACQNSCIRDNDCKQWTFNNRNQRCQLKGQVNQCHPNNNFTSGRIIQRNPNPITRTSTTRPGINYPDNNFRAMNVQNANTCKNACINDNQCRKWTFNTNNNRCLLKSGNPIAVQNPNRISGEIYYAPRN